VHLSSPGVERAVAAAAERAARRASTAVELLDYVFGLLDEDEGRPAELVTRLGLDLATVRERFARIPNPGAAIPLASLLDSAQNWSIRRRADPTILTDAFLVAVLTAEAEFQQAAARAGLDADQLAGLMAAEVNTPFARPDDPPAAFALPDTTDDMDAARILDANLSRAREALRVIEDHCRFVLNDRVLTEVVKELRHRLAAASAQVRPSLLLAARDTTGDVGTTLTAAGEYERGSVGNVAAVNLKRLQESLRSVEEYGKLIGSAFAREAEAIRYRSYTLERAVVGGAESRRKLADARLYVLLAGAECTASLDWTIGQAAAGGATVFQLREKKLSDAELVVRARNVRHWTHRANALFVVNDRPDLARLVGADGVHLGQDDLAVADARRIVGPNALIGVSTHSIEQVRKAVLDGADYIGVGPTFPSRTKAFDAFPGLDFVRSASAETSLPAFALGGISCENVGQVVAAGMRRVAVGAAVCGAEDPEAVARVLRAALD
jgi:thiamine-phosphate pyrophosphorylase